MTSMLSQDHEYYRSLSSHVSKLDAVQETVHKDQQHLSSLESDLENLKSTMSDMRAIREDYSPKMLNNNLERVDSRQLSSLFGPSSRGPGSRGPGSRGPMRSGSASGAEAALGAEAAPDGEDIEVKPTNRYPLRKRASAVSFAAKLVRSRKTKLLAAQKLEAELAAAARAAAEQKQRKRTMTLAEWKERRDRMREEAEAGSGAPSNLVSPAKPASPLKNAFPGVAPGVAPKFFPSPGKPTAAFSRMRSATTLEIGSPPDPSRRPLEPLDGPATSFGDSVLDKPRFKPLYDAFQMKQSKNQPRTPRRLYMQECASQETMPEPLITRTTKGVKSDGGVSLKNYGMGDKQIVALSSALSVMPVKHLDLSGNRILTSKAAVAVLQKLDPHALEWLDISKNRISPDAIGVICNLLLETSRLTVLGLEESNIRAAALQQLCESVSYRDVCPYTDVVIHECPLRQLNLAGNNIDDDGAQTIAQMVRKSKNLTTLDLSWNNIRRAGAVALFKAIGGEGGILQSLDIGYNAIGSTQDLEREAVKALARCINPEPNGCSLTHLNVSHNQMTEEDCMILGKALTLNHTLMGIHVEGNSGFLDSRGFLVPGADMYPNGNGGTLFSRILTPEGQDTNALRSNVEKESWACRSNCWICEKWQEFTFVWNPATSPAEPATLPPASYSVWLCTSFDGWYAQTMHYCDDTKDFRLCAMVPPGQNQYVFVVEAKALPPKAPAPAPDPVAAYYAQNTPAGSRAATPEGFPRGSGTKAANIRKETKEIKEQIKQMEFELAELKTAASGGPTKTTPSLSFHQSNHMDELQLLRMLELEGLIKAAKKRLLELVPPPPVIPPTIAMDQPTCKRMPVMGGVLGLRSKGKGKDAQRFLEAVPPIVNLVVIERPKLFDPGNALPPRTKEAVVVHQGKWRFENSNFKDFVQDTEQLLNDAFESDYAMTKIEKTIAKKGKNEDEVIDEQETKMVLRKHYADIKCIFKNFAAGIGSGNEIFAMGKNAYYNFLETCNVLDDDTKKGGLGRAEVAILFTVCQSVGPKSSFNKKNNLCRFQFMQAVVDMAIGKYRKPHGDCATTCEAVTKFIEEHCLRQSDLKALDEYRKDDVYTEEVDGVIRKNLAHLELVFKAYSGKFNLPNEKIKSMSFAEWGDLFFDSQLVSDGFIDRNVRIIFVRSQQTVVNEMADKSGRSMNFVEFLHGLCWTAGVADEAEKRLDVAMQRLCNRFKQHLKPEQRMKNKGAN
ncbi:hypothetical protein TeGR_g3632 [Tetraparma gracilis]|uniref:Uncharacterized protein n=1 Tax=Tetraparma gracilis TaxID=2962635 RepID=A0ABQ6MRR1_9STRA|nr:hypothetical protein TeGR_g3632 [Tetraparma gracilis]